MPDPTRPQTAVVTGAASGLGAAIAHEFARHGYHVVVADLQDDAGRKVAAEIGAAGGSATFQHCDITQDHDWQQLLERSVAIGPPAVLVNNAGVAAGGTIEAMPLADWQWIMEINVLGAVRGCKTFAPYFKQQGSGHIINIASAAALMTPPFMSSYNVSKSAVLSLSQTLQIELGYHGIGVSVVCPGFFRTNLGHSLRASHSVIETFFEKVMQAAKITATEVARETYRGYTENRFLIIPHKSERRLWLLRRLFPRRVESLIAKQFQKLATAIDD